MRRAYVAAYDISDPRRLRRVYRIMMGHGDPLQLSVFLCHLSDVERELLVDSLMEAMDPAADSVMFIDVGSSARPVKEWIKVIGKLRTSVQDVPRFYVV